jgi:c-di-GMP-binding flagellar brake protein YcgR
MISKTPFKEGSVFEVALIIPDYGEILINAKVVRVQKPHEDVKLYWSGFEFLDVNPKDRTAIIQFIFKKQLEDRRKFINNL